jgi:hypothetical protein
MPKLSPWTRLARRIEPLAEELNNATPWRIEDHQTVENWLHNLSWLDLTICDSACWSLCKDPPYLPHFPIPLTIEIEGSIQDIAWQKRMVQQVMHRLIFAMDLCRRLPKAYKKEVTLTI